MSWTSFLTLEMENQKYEEVRKKSRKEKFQKKSEEKQKKKV